jgi:allantoicase
VVDLIVEMVIWIIGVATQIIYVSGKAFGSMDGIIEPARSAKRESPHETNRSRYTGIKNKRGFVSSASFAFIFL